MEEQSKNFHENVREKVWIEFFGNIENEGLCPVCEHETIFRNQRYGFHLAHIIPNAVEKGPKESWNLIPTCAKCNGTTRTNMFDKIAENIHWRKNLKGIFFIKFISSILDPSVTIYEDSLFEFVKETYHPLLLEKYSLFLKIKHVDLDKIKSFVGNDCEFVQEKKLKLDQKSNLNDKLENFYKLNSIADQKTISELESLIKLYEDGCEKLSDKNLQLEEEKKIFAHQIDNQKLEIKRLNAEKLKYHSNFSIAMEQNLKLKDEKWPLSEENENQKLIIDQKEVENSSSENNGTYLSEIEKKEILCAVATFGEGRKKWRRILSECPTCFSNNRSISSLKMFYSRYKKKQ